MTRSPNSLRVTRRRGSTARLGLPPLKVVPALAFAGRRDIDVAAGALSTVGERQLPRSASRRGDRLSEAQVEKVSPV